MATSDFRSSRDLAQSRQLPGILPTEPRKMIFVVEMISSTRLLSLLLMLLYFSGKIHLPDFCYPLSLDAHFVS